MATIGTLQRLSASSLSQILLTAQEAAAAGDPTIAIIDVRDDGNHPHSLHNLPCIERVLTSPTDYIGGHIKGSQNIPSRTLDAMLPTLVRQLEGKETVVFHCALSQQRGPTAALRYIRERDRLLAVRNAVEQASGAAGAGGRDDTATAAAGEKSTEKKQQVFVLDRGFVGWQETYGTDERLTEGYRKELWEDGYWM